MNQKELRSWRKVFESDLGHIAYELKEILEKPALILLDGQMGVGKTTFCKVFLDESTLSPTYSVLHEAGSSLHADFYRIKNREEILHLELSLYLERKDYFLIEWGKSFYVSLLSEIPDEFCHYLLEIVENEPINGVTTRDFKLFAVSED
jgi:tRNA threonylcarbamoyladenosine biosynthesis protein TsaE